MEKACDEVIPKVIAKKYTYTMKLGIDTSKPFYVKQIDENRELIFARSTKNWGNGAYVFYTKRF